MSPDDQRQEDYEDLVRALKRWPSDLVLRLLGDALIGYTGPRVALQLTEYAEKYGWRQTIHVVYAVLPSDGAR